MAIQPDRTATPITRRFHVAIADVNAGLVLVPAVSNFAYRLVDAFAVAVGGAVAAVTTVDLIATLAASTRKLVAFAQASLTQSTLLRVGAAGAAILADGASFTINDVKTPLSIGKTGSDITTATFIDLELTFTAEKA